jgi:hypothetical protein
MSSEFLGLRYPIFYIAKSSLSEIPLLREGVAGEA